MHLAGGCNSLEHGVACWSSLCMQARLVGYVQLRCAGRVGRLRPAIGFCSWACASGLLGFCTEKLMLPGRLSACRALCGLRVVLTKIHVCCVQMEQAKADLLAEQQRLLASLRSEQQHLQQKVGWLHGADQKYSINLHTVATLSGVLQPL